MKKVLLMVAVAAFAMTTTSCKKDHTCTCTVTTGTITSSSSTTAKMTKKDAKTWCEGYNSSSSYGGVTSSVACALS